MQATAKHYCLLDLFEPLIYFTFMFSLLSEVLSMLLKPFWMLDTVDSNKSPVYLYLLYLSD